MIPYFLDYLRAARRQNFALFHCEYRRLLYDRVQMYLYSLNFIFPDDFWKQSYFLCSITCFSYSRFLIINFIWNIIRFRYRWSMFSRWKWVYFSCLQGSHFLLLHLHFADSKSSHYGQFLADSKSLKLLVDFFGWHTWYRINYLLYFLDKEKSTFEDKAHLRVLATCFFVVSSKNEDLIFIERRPPTATE